MVATNLIHPGDKLTEGLPLAVFSESAEKWQLAQYLESARATEPFDPKLFEDDDESDSEEVEAMSKDDIRQCTRDLLLLERAKEWLLED